MGTRDYRWREPKKPKKGTRRPAPISVLSPPLAVEVIKKGKQGREQEER
jgi:hypothetical protein